jgi:hypothetical protein
VSRPSLGPACLDIAQATIKTRPSFNELDHSGVSASATFNDTVVQKVALLLSARS